MSLQYFRGNCYAFAELMRKAAAEIKAGNGELKPAKVFARRADPRKTHIGLFAAKVLRFGRRERG